MVSLAEVLRCLERALSEEQAWALCFQCCSRMRQLARGLHPVLHAVLIKGPGSIFIHADGAVSFKVHQKSTDVGNAQQLEEKLLEYLGVVIYEALDWGIDSQVERELSEPLEKLLRLMLKLDNEAMKLVVTLQDVIKICEDRLPRPSEAASHYKGTCRSLFTDYMELQKLLSIIQTSRETVLWPAVIRELQSGVKLRKVPGTPQHHAPPQKCARSPYEMLADDIQQKRYTLRKVIIEEKRKGARVGAASPMPHLKPVLERKPKKHLPQEPSWHEHLMAEIKQLQRLQPSASKEDGSRPKGVSANCTCAPISGPILGDIKPVHSLSSSQQELRPYRRRSRSLESALQSKELICFSCRKQMFLKWPYSCYLCSSVVCCDCCIKMSMPFRMCVHLPLGFLKLLRLSKEEDPSTQEQKNSDLLHELEHWKCSSVPVTLEPHCLAQPLCRCTRTMTDWLSVDICTQCEQYLLNVASAQQHSISLGRMSRSWTKVE
ncbi:PREDICTED: protein spire homolog 1-like [Tinamus guttatus]|uniref:protein spire homolog 1-like n=1 Tax=Tinamus guttatus TaxID=94827 RepID=UPI00052EF1E1|nr:PREDICTED: protein spire homolog 1-like [Tinamus guttatus]